MAIVRAERSGAPGHGTVVAGSHSTFPGFCNHLIEGRISGSLARGTSEISGFLASEDCLATLGALRAMGVRIEQSAPDRVVVQGAPLEDVARTYARSVTADVSVSGSESE